jgi:hypothetical protein
LQKVLRKPSTHWFVLSDIPSVSGWNTVDSCGSIPRFLYSARRNWLLNVEPLSETVVLGVPCSFHISLVNMSASSV